MSSGFTFSMIQFFGNNLYFYSLSDNLYQLYKFNQKNQMIECQICCESKPDLVSAFLCSHQFCLDCLKGHISQKSSRFTQVFCPDPGCKKGLKKSAIINQLPEEVRHRLTKYQQFLDLQSNPNVRPCSIPNCPGRIDMTKSKKSCDTCLLPHCPKCMKGFHEGICVIDDHDRVMKSLNNQKCPQCGIWVQKKQGCDYIDCKCGTAFCYKCGAKFSEDPCRKASLWKKQERVRQALQKLKIRLPEEISGKVAQIFLLPLRLFFFVLLTVILSLLLVVMIAVFLCLIVVSSPFIMLTFICSTKQCWAKVLMLIFLPVLAALLAFFLLLIMILFPVMRNLYHHGIYDGVENVINELVLCYLGMASKILSFNE